ncbi:DNA translocase FtsK [Lichenifustis flavocetrariae]|uniref:FtsK/SpoIIIE domain-containing protein n=1 Tax=Lichenifustis flavocetrariae TaxID=2949735 RepID=A0AA41YVT0_9HYPH|nr:DNA translocase FtsK [Lichenifustis flavocetrariae]MCW6509524.1 FtsK/SpoIIIE domain-containing protein [Lichenifustis flavocetrariae]
MTLLKEHAAMPPETSAETASAGPDWQALYQSMMAQLMANMEGMVAHVLADHAAQHGLLLPEASATAVPPAPEPPPATGNAGLDAIHAQLHENAPSLMQPAAVPTPPWLRPFTLPANVRFTRTPDPVMRWERAMPNPEELAVKAREAARAATEAAAEVAQREFDRMRAESSDTTPIWRRPFTLPPNVRYTRTPDRVAKHDGASSTAEVHSIPASEPRAASAVDVQEAMSTSESPDGAYRAVTFTKTVTTVESVTVSTVEPTNEGPLFSGEMSEAAGPSEAPAETLSLLQAPNETAPATPMPLPAHRDSVAHSATWADHGLPSWFGAMCQSADLTASFAAHSPAPTPTLPEPATAVPSIDEDDSDGGAPWRARFLPDLEEVVSTAVAASAPVTHADLSSDPDADSGAALWRGRFLADEPGIEIVPAPVVIAAPSVAVETAAGVAPISSEVVRTPERRAFGSHGIPAFATAMHVDSDPDFYVSPPIEHLVMPRPQEGVGVGLTREALEQNARLLEGVLEDFGIRGEIIAVRPGPVVTLYELEPAPGVKSSRVVGLADDIARSMSAVSARVAVVQGRNVIGIELPNERRETVFLRELIGSEDFEDSSHRLAIALGKTIGGESVIVDLARMPHLLVAGTTGSGKSVAINTMILSLLYRMRPEECRLIMVDPKMLELSIYDGIPHLLTPVVTDSKKAVIALKWAVREMEDRYKKMAKVGVRNIDGFNARVAEAKLKGEVITRTVQQGFDRETGEQMFVTEEMDLATLPYIVIIVDEMADLMMVAGKEIEGAIQRLAQMARAAGIHLIMATQRPSVDVITGTIKANFPTRISFQVTSKIDSRTILGEQGAEQLLGQGDMLHMAGGGRIVRVHGPFVSDGEVENVVLHLKAQGRPEYLDVVTSDGEDEAEGDEDAGSDPVFDKGSLGDDSVDLYDQAVKVVLRDKKCSTSYIQRRLQVGYNKAASLVERMEKEGLVGAANHAGKREILNFSRDYGRTIIMPGDGD